MNSLLEISPEAAGSGLAMPAADFPGASIYHEPWWLDIATDGQWTELLVRDGDAVARLRYPLQLSGGLFTSRMPTLIRTLGPEYFGLRGKPVSIRRRRMALTLKLIEGLSGLAHFEQIFDPRVEDAVAFVRTPGFGVTLEYAYRSGAGLPDAVRRERMTDKVRSHIKTASNQLRLIDIADAGLFCDFHDACLHEQPNHHGAARMRKLIGEILNRRAGQILGAIDRSGVLVAALVIVWDDDAVRNLIAARDQVMAGGGALSFLIDQAMRIAADRGVAFDFDGAMTKGQLNFLSGFGADLVQRLVVWRTEPGYLPAAQPAAAIVRG